MVVVVVDSVVVVAGAQVVACHLGSRSFDAG